MEKSLTIYQYDTMRYTRIVPQKIRKELLGESSCCFICGSKPLNIQHFNVIPYVPIMLGGSAVDKSNVRLSCARCCSIKRKIDRMIIKGLKVMGVISGVLGCEIDSVWDLDLLKKFYSDSFDLIRLKKLDDLSWEKSIKEVKKVGYKEI